MRYWPGLGKERVRPGIFEQDEAGACRSCMSRSDGRTIDSEVDAPEAGLSDPPLAQTPSF